MVSGVTWQVSIVGDRDARRVRLTWWPAQAASSIASGAITRRPMAFRPGAAAGTADLQALQDVGGQIVDATFTTGASQRGSDAALASRASARWALVLAGAVLRMIRPGVGRVRSASFPSTSECLGVYRTLLFGKPFDDE